MPCECAICGREAIRVSQSGLRRRAGRLAGQVWVGVQLDPARVLGYFWCDRCRWGGALVARAA